MPGPVQSIERAAAILRLLAASSGRLGVGEIASSLGLARGTAHGILRTLERVGFVEQDGGTGKYQLGAALLHLGTSYLDVNELRSRAINWADALASRSGEAVRIGTLLDGKVLVVHHVFRPDDTLQALDVGSLLPLHATALGKALLAHDANAAASIRDTELESYCRRTITDPRLLARAATRVRENGWAAEVEELSIGEAGIAAPIRGYGGLVVGAIGISGAVERICDTGRVPEPRLVAFVRDAARAVSRDLGGSRW
ncbi:IclR family transcriptional regulator [Spirillospora sp. NPDC000708]|jgi:DNA-binding IclR family transcriptional regulator|uniref:Glycerol operon regulatory protein n=2 Tax=Actinomadura TaxID=1988 RepID=A0A6I4M9D2_9ACTN|nr:MULTISPECIES: IclR family transcriptional regulator [Actinomadura]MBD2895293.1 Glycerol operon regulatory protein [Actinomadura sp. RB99]MBO2441887.1 IclR family transcriptional regulator [Actinomadura nitritigenes]MWA02293.1 helix-turn-helix domain-containing protein [Actinomadura physcomitrii]MWA03135.1 helix-turn-helix domain-containing protein [Actinomadura physcomitrii]